jgi:membrane protein YqaA with SNARE-associated domain
MIYLFSLEIFLLIPLDAVFLFFCLQDRKKTIQYTLIASLASAMSASIGYLLGFALWDLFGTWIVPHLISQNLFNRLFHHLETYEHLAVFLFALLPLPLKALAIVAGVFQLPFPPFLLYLILARILRFATVASIAILWGNQFKTLLDRHFHHLFLALAVKILLTFFFFWLLAS